MECSPCGSVVEHSLGKGEVGSSILPMGTTIEVDVTRCSFAMGLIKELFKGRQKNGKRKVSADKTARKRGYDWSR